MPKRYRQTVSYRLFAIPNNYKAPENSGNYLARTFRSNPLDKLNSVDVCSSEVWISVCYLGQPFESSFNWRPDSAFRRVRFDQDSTFRFYSKRVSLLSCAQVSNNDCDLGSGEDYRLNRANSCPAHKALQPAVWSRTNWRPRGLLNDLPGICGNYGVDHL